MKTQRKTREQLINELRDAHRQIAELKTLEGDLKETLEQLHFQARLLDSVRESVVATDLKGYLIYWSNGAQELYGYSAEEAEGEHITFIINPEEREAEKKRIHHAIETGSWRGELRRQRKDGTTFWVDVVISLMADDAGQPYGLVSVDRDITEYKRLEEKLTYMATHDSLTGLPNRRLFDDRLKLALAQARRHQIELAVIFLDLDYFKDINDTLGHRIGDQLLEVVGERLTNLLRETDTIARMGGDEFLILLPEIARREDAGKVARKILEAVGEPVVVEGHDLYVTASVGISLYPDDGDDGESLMQKADIAMYQAKSEGKDNYQYYTAETNAELLTEPDPSRQEGMSFQLTLDS